MEGRVVEMTLVGRRRKRTKRRDTEGAEFRGGEEERRVNHRVNRGEQSQWDERG